MNYNRDSIIWHGVKVGPGYRDSGPRYPGTQEPPESLKVGPGTP